MNKSIVKKVSIFALVSVLLLTMVVGCDSTDGGNGEGSGGSEESKGTVEIGYVDWAEGVAMTNLAKVVLEDKMDYDVEITMADAGPIFTSVSSGSYDAFLDAWYPITHGDYKEKYEDDLTDLGYNYEGARIGLVVPDYVDVDSIEELKEKADEFDGEIIGIDSGAGIMDGAERAIEAYDLDLELISGSEATMLAALQKAIDNEDWIVVTGWTPHWKFSEWDLKFLDDSQESFGDQENLHSIGKKDIKEDMPEVAEFLENFQLNDEELNDLMGAFQDSDDDELEIARKWMEENEDLVESWIP
ncbi:MAG TPA: glycine betaine ABC transporter substrate-binding protein [Tissierellaceae bacterium]|nr:glycine betaine ABC transporter substrate-binding protein [Tissierellaceae bacterium]